LKKGHKLSERAATGETGIKKPALKGWFLWDFWSAREDLNLRPPTPHDTAFKTLKSPLLLVVRGIRMYKQTVLFLQNLLYTHQ